jgi:AAA domain
MPSALILDPDSTRHTDLTHQGFVPLADSGHWVHRDQLHHEAALLRAVTYFQNHPSPLNFPKDWLEAIKLDILANKKSKIDETELAEQLEAVFETFDHAACLSVITGPPGAAKSTVASLWAQIARAQYPDLPFIVITQEKPALDRLCDKINLQDALALTIDEAQTNEWPNGAVLIIDEAGLLGTETLSQLLTRAQDIDAVKIILIGDDKQLVPHAPGQPFRWLCQQEKTDCVILSQSFRQKNHELRRAVEALYKGNIPKALKNIPHHFLPPAAILPEIHKRLKDATPDKTFIVVHGDPQIVECLKSLCPGFRIFSLAASQGLAMDRVIFVLADPINKAELLVGCSRQRFDLDILIDSSIYQDDMHFAKTAGDYPQSLMALDIIPPQQFLDIFDQA